jgi:hypothetical protein
MLWDTTTAQSYRELRLMTDFSDGGEDENDGKGDLTRGEKVGHTGSPISVFKAGKGNAVTTPNALFGSYVP